MTCAKFILLSWLTLHSLLSATEWVEVSSKKGEAMVVVKSPEPCFLKKPVADALFRAHQTVRLQEFRLIVKRCYVPLTEKRPEPGGENPDSFELFVRHSRGFSIDVGLATADGDAVELPLGKSSTRVALSHRKILVKALAAEGFVVGENPDHFDGPGWQKEPESSVSLSELKK